MTGAACACACVCLLCQSICSGSKGIPSLAPYVNSPEAAYRTSSEVKPAWSIDCTYPRQTTCEQQIPNLTWKHIMRTRCAPRFQVTWRKPALERCSVGLSFHVYHQGANDAFKLHTEMASQTTMMASWNGRRCQAADLLATHDLGPITRILLNAQVHCIVLILAGHGHAMNDSVSQSSHFGCKL